MQTLIRRSAAYFIPARHCVHTSTAPLIRETGLYGFDNLKTAKGFRRMVDDAIERSNELVSYIAGMPSGPEIIDAMDEISNAVCTVIDSAELCRHTHPDREFVEEASNASLRINEYLHYLNSNCTLYHAVVKAEKDHHLLTEEAQRAAHYLRIDLEKGGIHLSPEKLDRVNQLNTDIVRLCREFNENIVADPGHVDIFPGSRVPKNLHHLAKPIYRPSGQPRLSTVLDGNKRERGFRLRTEPDALCSILQLASDPEVRKLAYVRGNSVPRANLVVLDKLIAARHEFAEIVGYKSYAEFALKDNMASSPEVVLPFLLDMSKMVRPKAEEVLASYFPLPQCIEGLKMLAESLFHVKCHETPLAPGESWHPDVLKLSLHHPDEGDLGYLYLDLKSREHKHPIFAHFAIKGGRRISETEYQLPIVALVCSFSGSNFTSVMLHHSDVETLFHEFGHALHSLLSRTDYQHFSGTRVVLDFAETPSNLFEYYSWDYRFLRKFAKHYSTGDPIPEELVKSMLGAKNMFAAIELQRQILYALIDQTLHGAQLSSTRDTSSIVADLRREHTCWKYVEGTHWHARFSHLVTYGAGYYSYLYAKCFAATIWQKLCQQDPLSLATGSSLRTKFLQHGGAKDPADILNDLVGSGMIRNQNGGIIPDITSLAEEMKL
ncbi:mitochondrial intermediate peptidase, mitochondrial isoform X2 [Olea europaea var. sylvestris]|uniref:mitochondrial intermediate peptidase, mitochondrial isoform X2 n=1 Tax=Olea europaea var. sylvestris TaxID=158386 RepID=UPI000C1D0F83|nr:mitochondrial intermediate peptidase, mitochondrial isoform X2 [Olea europaea var. sylvestris]